MEDYYKLIGVERKAAQETIKKKCQALFLKLHPDKQLNSKEDKQTDRKQAEEQTSLFIKVQQASKVLLDSEARKQYDHQLKEQELNHSSGPVYSCVVLDELEFDEDTEEYYMECRCGGSYVYEEEENDVDEVTVLIPCSNCTYHLELTL